MGRRRSSASGGGGVNWQLVLDVLTPVRPRWDLAILANLEAGPVRPADLLREVNAQAGIRPPLTSKVLHDTLRRLIDEGYVRRREVARFPREVLYELTGTARRLLAELDLLAARYAPGVPGGGQQAQAPGREGPGPGGEGDRRARRRWLRRRQAGLPLPRPGRCAARSPGGRQAGDVRPPALAGAPGNRGRGGHPPPCAAGCHRSLL